MKKYLNYSVEELLEDKEFVSIVQRMKNDGEWNQFLQSPSESNENILKAGKIIDLFKTTEGILPEHKKHKLWQNISTFNKGYKQDYKRRRIRNFSGIAASLLLIISIGSLIYIKSNPSRNHYQFSINHNGLSTENPLLVLSTGEKVDLKKDESEITILKDQDAIQINNDSIVRSQAFGTNSNDKPVYNEVVIPFGKKSKLVLEDGTKVWLNAGTRFAFPQRFTGRKREVYLEGEGYFEVAKNDNKPFIVSTNTMNVEVLGTKFNVCAYPSDNFAETVLLNGSVNVLGKGRFFSDKVIMAPGQKATYVKNGRNITLENELMPELYIAWVEGWYQFSNENFEEVLTKIERYYNVTFKYEQNLFSKALPVSGKLDLKESINEVMLVLSKVARIDYEISENSVIIFK
ncbi:FecR family protein [Gaoshiqia sp. Z1-71]|uniref:FecR family protein n=1 Tax=Gaoshiqia hydrogeniformans TaxID=3290090 RepID=UPI003BF8EB43